MSTPPLLRYWTDSFARNVAKVGAGAASATALSIAALPLLSRLYEPQSFGLLGTTLAITTAGACLATGRYEQAIALPDQTGEAMALRSLALRLSLGLSALMLPVCLMAPWLAAALGSPALVIWLYALPLLLALASCIQVEIATTMRRGDYSGVTQARIAQSLITVGIQCTAARLGHAGLLLGLLAGLIAQLLWLRRRLLKADTGAFPRPSMGLREAARRHAAFPRLILPSALVDLTTAQLPFFLGALWFGPAFVGFYSMATRATNAPASLISGSVAPVFYKEFPRALALPGEARTLLFRTWGQLLTIAALPFLLLAYFAEPLLVSLLGPAWLPAARIVVVLCPTVFLMFVSSPTSGAMIALGKAHLSPVFSTMFILYRLGGLWIGFAQDDYLLGLGCIAAAEIPTILIYNCIILRSLRNASCTHETRVTPTPATIS